MSARATPPDRHLLAALAVRLLEAAPADRDAIVAAATSRRPDLRAAIAGLAQRSSIAAESDPDPIEDLAELFEFAAAEGLDLPPDQSGARIGPYRLVRRLGQGAYGAVYLARRSGRDSDSFALKLLHPGVANPRSVRRFVREQRVLASLDHPGVARLVAAGAAPNGCPYLVMALIVGPSLHAFCLEHSPPLLDRVHLFAQICEAVQHVHAKGIVHRDLKPGNILVPLVDGNPRPVVIDFGVVRLIDHAQDVLPTTQGRLMGTRRYMSPEQRAGGVVDARSDIYSLGITMAEILPAAAVPATRSSREPAPLLSRGASNGVLPPALRKVVDRCTREHPADRYHSALELAEELSAFITAGERGPRALGSAETTTPPK
jgi:serine/threonine protein kinase